LTLQQPEKQIVLMPSGTGCVVWVMEWEGTARLVVGHDRIIVGGGDSFLKKKSLNFFWVMVC